EPSPLLPQAVDEPVAGDAANGGEPDRSRTLDDVVVDIDFDGLDRRIVALDVPQRAYSALTAGPAGKIFYLETQALGGPGAGSTLRRYDLRERSGQQFLTRVQSFTLSHDRKKLLY